MLPPIPPLAVNMNWSKIIDPIGQMFGGGNMTSPFTGVTHHVEGILGNDPTLTAGFIFIIFFIMTAVLGLGMLVGSVVLLPTMFIIFTYVPNFRIVVAIICGLLFGFGLHKMIRR